MRDEECTSITFFSEMDDFNTFQHSLNPKRNRQGKKRNCCVVVIVVMILFISCAFFILFREEPRRFIYDAAITCFSIIKTYAIKLYEVIYKAITNLLNTNEEK